ncbi:MAG: aliphatic nitrilase [Rhodospirillaceae bacterium]|nr:aliphatic nitrilase [Magnetovibrio sp.]MAY67964.1 aliphatic nitrilase [Rhodospirillaceae bacterium]
MTDSHQVIRVAAAHTASPLLDKRACVEKACRLVGEAAGQGAQFLVFPESFIPGFPIWNALARPIDGHDWFVRMARNSLRVDGPEIKTIAEAAAHHGVMVSLGFSELSPVSDGALWNAAVLIGADGRLLNHHRKLVPTFYEKLTWNPGDAAGLRVIETPIGRVGGLICGENGNPLSRYMMMAQNEELHAANYPPLWPFKNPVGTAPYDLAEAIRVRAAAHAFEAKVFVVVGAGFLDDAGFEMLAMGDAEREAVLRASPRSTSMIVAPSGEMLGTPLTETEGLVIADIDLSSLLELKQHHDMAGYYNRMDIYQLHVDRCRPVPVYFNQPDALAAGMAEDENRDDRPAFHAGGLAAAGD